MSRPYRKRARARKQDETRQRIVRATMELHAERGPADTSISAIAERAGVQRLTVYRHFPDERALISACSSLHLQEHPLPSFERWSEISDPTDRTRSALEEVYGYYDRAEPMMEKIFRDVSRMPALADQVRGVSAALDQGRDLIVAAWSVDDGRQRILRATIGHALAFHTWQSLVRHQNLTTAEGVAVMLRLIQATADATASPQDSSNE